MAAAAVSIQEVQCSSATISQKESIKRARDEHTGEKEEKDEDSAEKKDSKRLRWEPSQQSAHFTAEHRRLLEEKGYVVVSGVVDIEDCREWRNELLQYLNSGPAHGTLSWDTQSGWLGKYNPTATIHNINRTAAHLPCLYKARQHPAVVQVFADLHRCEPEEMVVSLDGWNAAVAPKRNKPLKLWAHTDKDPSPCPFECVQGQVVLFDCLDAEKDGGLVVWEGSHKAHAGYFQQHPGHGAKNNWYRYPDTYIDNIEKDGSKYVAGAKAPMPMPRVNVTARAGDVVLWKSTTTHQSRPPAVGGKPRAVIYLAYAQKRFLRGEAEIAKRRKAFVERQMTSHWPVHDVRIFGKPRIYSAAEGEVFRQFWAQNPLNFLSLDSVLTDLGLSLLCIGPGPLPYPSVVVPLPSSSLPFPPHDMQQQPAG